MNREQDVRILLFDEATDIVADFSVRELSLVRPQSVDQAKISPHPLRTVREQNVVKTGQSEVNASRLFKRLTNLCLKSGRRSGDLNSSCRAVVSLPCIRG